MCNTSVPPPSLRQFTLRSVAFYLLLVASALFAAGNETRADTLATNLDTLLTNQDGFFTYSVEVSNHNWENAPVAVAQKFSTGSNVSGYTLSSVTICMVWFDSLRSVPKVSIYTVGSDGNPDTSKYVLTNPTLKHAGYGEDFTACDPNGLNTFTAPSNAVLDPDTDYFVVFENAGTQATKAGTYSAYNIGKVLGGGEGLGASGWSLGDNEHTKDTSTSSWATPGASLRRPVRMKIEGTAGGLANTTAPTLDSATVDGTSLVPKYDENLDEDPEPATSDYSVSVAGGTGAAPSSVDVTGKEVTLRLERAVIEGQTVTASYIVPTSNPVRDISDSDAQKFTDETVDNQSTVTPYRPRPPTGLTASADGSTRIDLSWTAPGYTGNSPVTGYKVEVPTDAGNNWAGRIHAELAGERIETDAGRPEHSIGLQVHLQLGHSTSARQVEQDHRRTQLWGGNCDNPRSVLMPASSRSAHRGLRDGVADNITHRKGAVVRAGPLLIRTQTPAEHEDARHGFPSPVTSPTMSCISALQTVARKARCAGI